MLRTHRQQPLSGSVLRRPGTAVRAPDCLWQYDRFCDKAGSHRVGEGAERSLPILLGCLWEMLGVVSYTHLLTPSIDLELHSA